MAKSNNPRKRNFNILCYDEHIKELRKNLTDYTEKGVIRAYYLILHRAETDEKQNHYHCCIEFWQAKTKTAVSKNMGLDERFIEYNSSVRAFVNYMLHRYERGKIKYNITEIDTNDRERLFFLYNQSNDMKADSINEFFDTALDIINNNWHCPWWLVFRKLQKNSNIDCKLLGRYASALYNVYQSYECDKGKKISMSDCEIEEMLDFLERGL